jgi:hypothetical protein
MNSIELNLNPIDLNWIWIPFNVFKLNLKIWTKFQFVSTSIQFKFHAMSFNIFMQMELNFHKVNFFFFISWLSVVVHHK